MGTYGKEEERNGGLGDPKLVRSKSAVMGYRAGLQTSEGYRAEGMDFSSLAPKMEPGFWSTGRQVWGSESKWLL